MGSTKFMVIKFRELLKTAVFAVLGIIIIIALIYFFMPKNNQSAKYTAGTYTSQITLNNETVDLKVTVDNKKIKSVELVHTAETIPVFYPLLETTAQEIGKEIVKNQSLDIDIPSEAEYTAKVILDAVKESLEEASAK